MTKYKKYLPLYFLLIPGFLYLVIYRYLPMAGLVMVFKEYRYHRTIWGSPWIGLENFRKLFESGSFGMIFSNTIIISLYKLVFGFSAPIIVALMLNEIKSIWVKRSIQTAIYLPHFISWVVVSNIIFMFFAPSSGIISKIYMNITGNVIDIMINPSTFRGLLVASDIWKEVGWGSIIYLAAITGIDPELYQAAIVDGANKRDMLWHITIPGIMMTIMTMFLLRVGSIMNVGFEQIFILQNSLVYNVSEVLDTYTYKLSFGQNQPAVGAAVGLFKGIIGLVLVLSTNKLAKILGQDGVL
jgi:putative aldouronate transport system permease protein